MNQETLDQNILKVKAALGPRAAKVEKRKPGAIASAIGQVAGYPEKEQLHRAAMRALQMAGMSPKEEDSHALCKAAGRKIREKGKRTKRKEPSLETCPEAIQREKAKETESKKEPKKNELAPQTPGLRAQEKITGQNETPKS